jgi:hypothetical protein
LRVTAEEKSALNALQPGKVSGRWCLELHARRVGQRMMSPRGREALPVLILIPHCSVLCARC